MKFNLSLALLTSTVIANGTERKKEASCASPMACKIQEFLLNSPEFAKKALECDKEKEEYKKEYCFLIAGGMKPEQIQFIEKITRASEGCAIGLKEKAQKCAADCQGDGEEKCAKKCLEILKDDINNCMAKKANLSNFDFKKADECSNSCIKKELSELSDISEMINCNYKCGEELYKGLGAEMKFSDNKNDKKDGKEADDKKSDNKKDDDKKVDDKKADGKKPDEKTKEGKSTSNANRVQFGSLNLVAFALPLAYLFFN